MCIFFFTKTIDELVVFQDMKQQGAQKVKVKISRVVQLNGTKDLLLWLKKYKFSTFLCLILTSGF